MPDGTIDVTETIQAHFIGAVHGSTARFRSSTLRRRASITRSVGCEAVLSTQRPLAQIRTSRVAPLSQLKI